MKKLVCIVGIICLWNMKILAQDQYLVSLSSNSQQSLNLQLIDDKNNDRLFKLPVTFYLTKTDGRDILIMMLGDGSELLDEQTVWMFSSSISTTDLIKKNRNVSVNKVFKSLYPEFNTFFSNKADIVLYSGFDEGYEIIRKNPKPVFFQIYSSKQITFNLHFYVATSEKKYPYMFRAKCVPVKINLVIK
jgi:hypothetical protein